jgi:ABC-type Fe3+-siderophore transport system permease subunit
MDEEIYWINFAIKVFFIGSMVFIGLTGPYVARHWKKQGHPKTAKVLGWYFPIMAIISVITVLSHL